MKFLHTRGSSIPTAHIRSPHPRMQPTVNPVVLKYFLLKRSLHRNGPIQFKPMLFKGQLCICVYIYTCISCICLRPIDRQDDLPFLTQVNLSFLTAEATGCYTYIFPFQQFNHFLITEFFCLRLYIAAGIVAGRITTSQRCPHPNSNTCECYLTW